MVLRDADRRDLQAIDDIYNHYVITSTCTLQTVPDTLADRVAWFDRHGPDHPVIVIEEAGEVVAWGSLSRYHVRDGYSPTVEDSIYVRHTARGRGLGRALLDELLVRAARAKHHSVLALITADQPASLRLHGALGFTRVALLREVGFKLGAWVDVVILQKMVG